MHFLLEELHRTHKNLLLLHKKEQDVSSVFHWRNNIERNLAWLNINEMNSYWKHFWAVLTYLYLAVWVTQRKIPTASWQTVDVFKMHPNTYVYCLASLCLMPYHIFLFNLLHLHLLLLVTYYIYLIPWVLMFFACFSTSVIHILYLFLIVCTCLSL